jgi:hypothetical protein
MSGKFPRSPIMHSLPKMRNPPWLLPPLSPGATNKIPSPSEIAASIAAAGQRDMASARQDKRPLAVTGKPLRGPRPPHPNPPWWAPGGSGIDPNKTAPASNAPVIGNAPNGRPVTGAYSRQPGNQTTAAPDMAAYSPGRAQPQQASQGTPYGQPAAPQPTPAAYGGARGRRTIDYIIPRNEGVQPLPQQPSQGTPYGQPAVPQPNQPSYAMPQFDYEGMMRQAQEQMRQYYQQFMPQVAPQPAVPMSAPQVAPRHSQPATPPAPPPSPQAAAPMPSPRVQDMFQAGGPMFTPFAFTMPMGPPSPADLPPEQRPPGFTQTFTDPFGNQTQNNPMAQRDALIQRINEESLPYYMGQPGQFRPNLQELWGQAGNMVSNGWANPLAGLFG